MGYNSSYCEPTSNRIEAGVPNILSVKSVVYVWKPILSDFNSISWSRANSNWYSDLMVEGRFNKAILVLTPFLLRDQS